MIVALLTVQHARLHLLTALLVLLLTFTTTALVSLLALLGIFRTRLSAKFASLRVLLARA